MTWSEIVGNELAQARRELAEAEEGLKAGTPAAHARYTRALFEAERAEQRANQASRRSFWNAGLLLQS
ncbi:hypothetical protein [Hyalangium rubrum]|uniref:Uncharacterized protein n=1 Tax=Hyalangium rubrum TaxID=3103134 RepID=A0ABU5H3I3_9BACT|nr:hypothetical protein [Hyalangium sp. s54d21]MDY7228023.1 hypothetical protein [Hyalangium sp. s54d21]